MQVVLDSANINICYDPARKRLYQTWKGYLSVEEFIIAIDISLEYFRKHDINSILSDTTDQAVLAKEGSDYAARVTQEMVKLGLEKIAFVMPKSFFAKLAVEDYTRNTHGRMVGHFSTREEADNWLDKIN
ncbi:hypothetical protein D770_08575 [Flammeovirgaceae bacterium 311]|nr:hypothetical protein D770_08575 [Flammeovirgaceae bacterium 311]